MIIFRELKPNCNEVSFNNVKLICNTLNIQNQYYIYFNIIYLIFRIQIYISHVYNYKLLMINY